MAENDTLMDDVSDTPIDSYDTEPHPSKYLSVSRLISEDTRLHAALSSHLTGDTPLSLLQYCLSNVSTDEFYSSSPIASPTLSDVSQADAKRLAPSDMLALTTLSNNVLKSIPHSVLNFYTDLLAAYLLADTQDGVPAKFAYTATSGKYGAQVIAYGLDPLLDSASTNPRTPLLSHPQFDLESFHALLILTRTQKHVLYCNMLLRALIPKLLAHDVFVDHQQKAPKSLTYAAATSKREPVRAKPKRNPRQQAIQPTPLPCARCLATATILTTTSRKYTHQLTVKTRGVTFEEYQKSLPGPLRKEFKGIFDALTQNTPNHSERQACPCSNASDRRDLFATSSNARPTLTQRENMQKAMMVACKANGICLECGRSRTSNSAINHLHCNPGPKLVPPAELKLVSQEPVPTKCLRHPPSGE